MIRTYIEYRDQARKHLEEMKEDIERFYTDESLLGKRVRVRGYDTRNGNKVDFTAFYMGVKLITYVEDVYLEIIFNKEFKYDKSQMINERDYRLTRWDESIRMNARPYKRRKEIFI